MPCWGQPEVHAGLRCLWQYSFDSAQRSTGLCAKTYFCDAGSGRGHGFNAARCNGRRASGTGDFHASLLRVRGAPVQGACEADATARSPAEPESGCADRNERVTTMPGRDFAVRRHQPPLCLISISGRANAGSGERQTNATPQERHSLC